MSLAQIWFYSLLSVLATSLVALVGIFTISIKVAKLKKALFFLVAFAAGALLGDVFLHIIPEIGEAAGFTLKASFSLLAGLLAFFVLEKFLAWRHCHNIDCQEGGHRRLGAMNLVGDGFHNLSS